MNRDDVKRIAWEVGIFMSDKPAGEVSKLERFAALIESAARAAEREECARVCEETTAAWTQHLYNSGCMDCAAAIRARGES